MKKKAYPLYRFLPFPWTPQNPDDPTFNPRQPQDKGPAVLILSFPATCDQLDSPLFPPWPPLSHYSISPTSLSIPKVRSPKNREESKTAGGVNYMNDMLKLEEGGVGQWGSAVPQVCESCRAAPCAVYCRADAAALCAACDAEVHSANPLARRHQRVPVAGPTQMPGSVGAGGCVIRPGLSLAHHHGLGPVRTDRPESMKIRETEYEDEDEDEIKEEDEEEASSWLLLEPMKNGEKLDFGFGDEFLDLGGSTGDSAGENPKDFMVVPNEQQQKERQRLHVDLMYDGSKCGFGYGASLSQSVS